MAENKVSLREYTHTDYDELRYWLKGDREWKKLDGPYFQRPADDQVDEIIRKRMESDIDRAAFPSSMVVADAGNGRFYGEVTRYWICKKTKWPAIGILIYDPSHWGRGYATEALCLWEKIVFDGLPDSWRIDIETWSGNPGMMKVAEKLGYKLEGRFTKARKVGNEYFDDLRYGKLRTGIL